MVNLLERLFIIKAFIFFLFFVLKAPRLRSEELRRAQQENIVEYLFAHGLAAGKKQFASYLEIVPLEGKGQAFDCIDAYTKPLYPSIFRIPPTAFGQHKDIEILTQAIQKINIPIVGIGVSKGAACWINTAALPENINKIAALVLESSFADVNEVIRNFKYVNYLNYVPCGHYITQICAKKILCHYDPAGLQPIQSIKNIKNKNLPILIIHSKKDRLIHINHSRRLYKKFLKNNFTNVYLVETETGHHAGIIYTDQSKLFQKAVNSFYKKFGLPYKQEFGFINLEDYQPSLKEVEKRIKDGRNYSKEYFPELIKCIIALIIIWFLARKFIK